MTHDDVRLVLQALTILVYLVGFAFLIRQAVRLRRAQHSIRRNIAAIERSTQRLQELTTAWAAETPDAQTTDNEVKRG